MDTFFSLEDFEHRTLWKEDLPWSALLYLEDYLQKFDHKIEIDLPFNITVINPHLVSIGKGTKIDPNVLIEGPCIIGKNCQISHGAYLRKNTLLSERCFVGHSAEIKHSILFPGARATHFTYVGDSILGKEVNLSAGVKCANLRLDRKEITVFLNEVKIETNLKKMGAILGDLVQVGCNAVLNPGSLLEKNSIVYPLVSVSGWIPMGSKVDQKGIKCLKRE